jgi:membrane protease YdiL (CAAX protease family)
VDRGGRRHAGVLAATIPFGLLHFQKDGNSWRHAVPIALAGATFGWMRQETGSTRAAAIMHASYNALFFFVLFAQRSYRTCGRGLGGGGTKAPSVPEAPRYVKKVDKTTSR